MIMQHNESHTLFQHLYVASDGGGTEIKMRQKHETIKMSDVANDAGVSLATVSRVINNTGPVKQETYDAVLSSIKKLGYILPHKEDSKNDSDFLGTIIINTPNLNNPFYSEIISGARLAALRHRYHLLVNEMEIAENNFLEFIDMFKNLNIQGLITTNPISPLVLKRLENITTLTQCCECTENVECSSVTIDDYAAAMNVVHYLIGQGCKRIAYIGGPKTYKYSQHRLKGYLAALSKAAITPDSNIIVHLPDIRYNLAVTAASQLLSQGNPPDAFFTCSDVYATAVIRAAHLAHFKIPEDIMVTGFDNIEFSSITVPSITSVRQPRQELGFMACELLLEKLNFPSSPCKKMILDTELIIRESTT